MKRRRRLSVSHRVAIAKGRLRWLEKNGKRKQDKAELIAEMRRVYPNAAKDKAYAACPAQASDCFRGMTYGERHSPKSFKELKKADIVAFLDDAYRCGEKDKGNWASGMMEDLRRQIKEARKTTDDYGERMARAELLANLLMEKHGYPRT